MVAILVVIGLVLGLGTWAWLIKKYGVLGFLFGWLPGLIAGCLPTAILLGLGLLIFKGCSQ